MGVLAIANLLSSEHVVTHTGTLMQWEGMTLLPFAELASPNS